MGTGPDSDAPVLVDVSGELCPMTWVRTRLALERAAPGQLVHVLLGPGDMLRNVPVNAVEDGHEIVSLEPLDSLEPVGAGRHRLVLRRMGPGPGGI